MRGQYSGHIISIDQSEASIQVIFISIGLSEASIQFARGQLLHADLCCQLLIGHLIPHSPSHVHNLFTSLQER